MDPTKKEVLPMTRLVTNNDNFCRIVMGDEAKKQRSGVPTKDAEEKEKQAIEKKVSEL